MIKPKKCRECRGKFTPKLTTQVVCSPKCALLLAQKKRQKEVRQNDKIRKAKLKTKSDFIKDAQKAFNRYIRARDYSKPCVSCMANTNDNGLLVGSRWDCGHMYSVGARANLRFNVFNAAKQCVKCNRNLSGNALNFRLEQINRIGLDRVEKLDNDRTVRKYSIEYLKRIKAIFNKRARLYKKRFR